MPRQKSWRKNDVELLKEGKCSVGSESAGRVWQNLCLIQVHVQVETQERRSRLCLEWGLIAWKPRTRRLRRNADGR